MKRKPAAQPVRFAAQIAAVRKIIADMPTEAPAILDDLDDLAHGRRGWYHPLILSYCDDIHPDDWCIVANHIAAHDRALNRLADLRRCAAALYISLSDARHLPEKTNVDAWISEATDLVRIAQAALDTLHEMQGNEIEEPDDDEAVTAQEQKENC